MATSFARSTRAPPPSSSASSASSFSYSYTYSSTIPRPTASVSPSHPARSSVTGTGLLYISQGSLQTNILPSATPVPISTTTVKEDLARDDKISNKKHFVSLLSSAQLAGILVAAIGTIIVLLGVCFYTFVCRRRRAYEVHDKQSRMITDKFARSLQSTPDPEEYLSTFTIQNSVRGFRSLPATACTNSDERSSPSLASSTAEQLPYMNQMTNAATYDASNQPSTPSTFLTNSVLLPERPGDNLDEASLAYRVPPQIIPCFPLNSDACNSGYDNAAQPAQIKHSEPDALQSVLKCRTLSQPFYMHLNNTGSSSASRKDMDSPQEQLALTKHRNLEINGHGQSQHPLDRSQHDIRTDHKSQLDVNRNSDLACANESFLRSTYTRASDYSLTTFEDGDASEISPGTSTPLETPKALGDLIPESPWPRYRVILPPKHLDSIIG